MMPLTLTLVRHGKSESNVAKRAFEEGNPVAGEKGLMGVHTSERRLTKKGVWQSGAAGAWLNTWLAEERINRAMHLQCYMSPYVRAMETAGHLGLGVRWRIDNRLCERNWGVVDQLTHEERHRRFQESLKKREEFAFFWRPEGGDSLQVVYGWLRDFLGTLHRECSQKHVAIVTHGETMWAFRALLEHWHPWDLRNAMLERNERTRIHNCRIIQYSRDSHDVTGWGERILKFRMVNPEHPDDPEHNLAWQNIVRKEYSDAELLALAAKHTHFLTT